MCECTGMDLVFSRMDYSLRYLINHEKLSVCSACSFAKELITVCQNAFKSRSGSKAIKKIGGRQRWLVEFVASCVN
jgi:hypothetical protein